LPCEGTARDRGEDLDVGVTPDTADAVVDDHDTSPRRRHACKPANEKREHRSPRVPGARQGLEVPTSEGAAEGDRTCHLGLGLRHNAGPVDIRTRRRLDAAPAKSATLQLRAPPDNQRAASCPVRASGGRLGYRTRPIRPGSAEPAAWHLELELTISARDSGSAAPNTAVCLRNLGV
jgi:hypothetical protein